jgi:hypothetical protein
MRALQPLLSGLKEVLYGVRQSATVQALGALMRRDLSLEDTRRFFHQSRRLRRGPAMRVVGVFKTITDWPVLLVAMATQVAILAPSLFPWATSASHMALSYLSAWWQVLLLILAYAGLYVLFSFVQARVIYGDGRQEADAAMLDLVEGVIRRRVADTENATLSPGD